jgi:hypothetical protein
MKNESNQSSKSRCNSRWTTQTNEMTMQNVVPYKENTLSHNNTCLVPGAILIVRGLNADMMKQ